MWGEFRLKLNSVGYNVQDKHTHIKFNTLIIIKDEMSVKQVMLYSKYSYVVIFKANMQNNAQLHIFNCDDLLIFFVLCNNEVNFLHFINHRVNVEDHQRIIKIA